MDERPAQPRLDGGERARLIQLENRGVTSHREQHELWSPRHHHRQTIAAKLRECGLTAPAEALEQCHTRISYAVCCGCRKAREFRNRCDRTYCPCCQPRLAVERRKSIEWWTKEITQPKHVVLTIRNSASLTKEHIQEIKAAFSRLRRMKFASGWRGGFYALECTNEGRGWHLHVHALVDAHWIDGRELSLAWNRATRGAGYIVSVKDCRSRTYLQEVAKYAVKGSALAGWPAADVAAFVLAFEGQRTFGVFGSLYGLRTAWRDWLDSLQAERPVCECGCADVRILTDLEWEAEQLTLGPPTCHPAPASPNGRVTQIGLAMSGERDRRPVD